jgi:glycosyltransferase involved in cell wall biosynthesis
MRALDLFVNASDAEPFGLVLLEAMEAGVPVLAPRHAGPAEIIDHERTGWLVASAAAGDLARGIETLIGSAELRARISMAAQRRRREHFTGERMTREMEDLLRKIEP